MSKGGLTVGTVAKQAGVNVETIRYYQRRGLLPIPELPPGSVRHYAAETVQRVRFVKRAQQLGFSLEEITDLLQLGDSRHCAETREAAERKLLQLEAKIADLKAMHDSLAVLIKACRKPGAKAGCPIIEALAA